MLVVTLLFNSLHSKTAGSRDICSDRFSLYYEAVTISLQ